MKIALIYPPFRHKMFNENLALVDHEFGRFPYISYGYLACEAKRLNHHVKLFDAAATKKSYDETLSELKKYGPDFLAFAAHAAQSFHDMTSWAYLLKKDLGLPSLVGGYEAKRYPMEIMAHDCFDFLCADDISPFFEKFLRVFEDNGDYNSVPNLYYRTDGRINHTFNQKSISFREHPIPDRSIFDNSLYYSHVSQRKNFTIGFSSIGCPYNCSYCCMHDSGFVPRSAEQTADEMEECIKKHNIHEIDWFDPIMLFSKKRIYKLCSIIKERKLDIIWSSRTRVETLMMAPGDPRPDEKFLDALEEGKCKRLFIGIESGSNTVLENVNKVIELDKIRPVLEAANKRGIRILGFFMLGNPGETMDTIRQTIKFSKQLPLDYAQFSMTIMKPHTELAQKYMTDIGKEDYWRNYILGKEKEKALPMPWTKLTRAEIEKITLLAYLEFYLRPRYILKAILKIRSLREIIRYSKVLLKFINSYLLSKIKK